MSCDLQNPAFHDEAKAREALEAIRWPDGPFCPHCGNSDQEKIAKGQGNAHRAGLYYCAECNGQFTVTVGTVMERSKIPLSKWLFAMHLMGASKKGMSELQLQRMLGVTYKTAWFLCHRIREATTPTTRGPHPVPPEQPLIHEPLPFDMQIVLKRQLERCHRSASQKWEALTERRPQFMPAHLIVFESTPRIIV